MEADYDLERKRATAKIHALEGAEKFHLELFGDDLAAREGYKVHDGLEAVRYFLMQKHGWLPRDVLNMSAQDLRFAMAEEMRGWVVPKKYRQLYPIS